MLNLPTFSNIPFLYLILFFAVFTLLLVESIYYIKKQGNQEDSSGYNQPASPTQTFSINKIIIPILGVVIIGFGVFYFFTKRNTTTVIPSSSISKINPSPTDIPTQQKPSENQLPTRVSITPTVPVISPFLTSTLIPSPSKKTTPTKAPTPTKTIKPQHQLDLLVLEAQIIHQAQQKLLQKTLQLSHRNYQ